LTVGTSAILARQLSLLRELTSTLLIVGGPARSHLPDPPRHVPDRIPGAGALGGLYTALIEAPTEHVLVVACDMPFLTTPFLRHLMEHAAGADAVVPRDGTGQHPLCAVYARRVAAHLHSRIAAGHLRVSAALADLAVKEVGPEELAPFDTDGRLLYNVNTPDDYERIRT
jgi:molybdopterin-guanine dinucleotide biosynthesis protein A